MVIGLEKTMNELEFYTIDELLDEILKRPTFCGIVIHTKDEIKNNIKAKELDFLVKYNTTNLSEKEVIGILKFIGDKNI